MGQQATSYLKNRIAELPKSIVNDRLSFEDEDIAKIILHSSFFTIPYPFQCTTILKIILSYLYYFSYFKIWHIILFDIYSIHWQREEESSIHDQTSEMPECASVQPNVCIFYSNFLNSNRRVGRRLQNPVGRWKVTDMNFFNRLAMDTFVSQDSHSYYFRWIFVFYFVDSHAA